MLLGLKNAHALIGLITLFLAYLFTIAPAGFFRSWVAKKMGDSTAEELGFLTLNPLVHIDFFGLLWLLVFSRPGQPSGFGWGKHIPINPQNIQGNWRWLKLCCAFFSDSLAHFVMATLAFSAVSILFIERAATQTITAVCPTSTDLMIFQILFVLVSLNVFLVLIQALVNGVILIAMRVSDGTFQTASYLYYFVLFAPLIVLILFGKDLQHLLFWSIASVEKVIAVCFGSGNHVTIQGM